MSSLCGRAMRRPVRPVSAHSGREFIDVVFRRNTYQSGRSPSRGHGGALIAPRGAYAGLHHAATRPEGGTNGGPSSRRSAGVRHESRRESKPTPSSRQTPNSAGCTPPQPSHFGHKWRRSPLTQSSFSEIAGGGHQRTRDDITSNASSTHRQDACVFPVVRSESVPSIPSLDGSSPEPRTPEPEPRAPSPERPPSRKPRRASRAPLAYPRRLTSVAFFSCGLMTRR